MVPGIKLIKETDVTLKETVSQGTDYSTVGIEVMSWLQFIRF